MKSTNPKDLEQKGHRHISLQCTLMYILPMLLTREARILLRRILGQDLLDSLDFTIVSTRAD